MQFHDYTTLRNRAKQLGQDVPRGQSSSEFCERVTQNLLVTEERGGLSVADNSQTLSLRAAVQERLWRQEERPFYNVWPIAFELASSIKLELPFSSVAIPFNAILLRFPRGHEFKGVATAMLSWFAPAGSDRMVVVVCHRHSEWTSFHHEYHADEPVEAWLESLPRKDAAKSSEDLVAPMVRLVVFIGLLYHDRDMVTPIVLSKDKRKYDSTDDPGVKKWLEDRAARRMGRGLDIGRKLQEQKDSSPHWRNPHLCLFWTGDGRKTPIIKMRSGAVVQKVSMADVPTGYIGPERAEEDIEDLTWIYFIEAIGQKRVKIGKADNPRERLKTLQTGSAVELRLIGVVRANANREHELHAEFAEERIQGEWFHATERLMNYIEHYSEPDN